MSRRRVRWQIVAAGAGVLAIGVLAFIAYGGTGTTGTSTQQLRAWVNGTGLGQSLGTVVGDTARVRVAVDEHQGSGVLHTDCGVLLTDAQSANGELPTPNTELTDLLSSGYASRMTPATTATTPAAPTRRCSLARPRSGSRPRPSCNRRSIWSIS